MYIYLVTSYDPASNPDFIADFTLFILWSEIEVNVAMIVSCMPVLTPIATRLRDGVLAVLGRQLASSDGKVLEECRGAEARLGSQIAGRRSTQESISGAGLINT